MNITPASGRAYRRAEPDARRRALIAAAARVLARAGASGASVRAIAQEAGVSPGLIGHYFEGVEGLLAETYREVGAAVDAAIDRAVGLAGPNPRARLAAFVMANFTPPVADPALLGTWIALWSLVAARPLFRALHDAQYAAFRDRVEALLGEAGVPAARRRAEATALTALIDGLWLELCLSPDALSTAAAGQIAATQLDRAISPDR